MHRWLIISLLLSAISFRSQVSVSAQSGLRASNNQAELDFPDRITFRADLQSEAEITRVVLEYGVEQLTCGSVVAKAFPDFTPGPAVRAEWTWEMLRTGSEPPGAKIWWRWRVSDSAGNELLTERQSLVWLDDQHPWQTVSGNRLNLHWYGGGRSFGPELHVSALASLEDLERATGLRPDQPIDLYIYASAEDMRQAILYEPGWTGGLAYPDNNVVIIGIAPDEVEWGKRTQAHELTHVLIGHLTFSCLGDVPTWLNEGLAVYGEGGPDSSSQRQFEEAVAADELFSVRALSGNFSEDPAVADVSYTQSYSLVNFLVGAYGRDKMLELLRALRDGEALEPALIRIYGFDLDGFEDAWRAQIGAAPRTTGGVASTPTLAPTPVPTIAPISGVPLAPAVGSTPAIPPTMAPPTRAPAITPPAPVPPARPALPIGVWVLGGFAAACVLALALAGAALAAVARLRQRGMN
jgi:hypothetical protein